MMRQDLGGRGRLFLRIGLGLFATLILIFQFQNCGRNFRPTGLGGTDQSSSSNSYDLKFDYPKIEVKTNGAWQIDMIGSIDPINYHPLATDIQMQIQSAQGARWCQTQVSATQSNNYSPTSGFSLSCSGLPAGSGTQVLTLGIPNIATGSTPEALLTLQIDEFGQVTNLTFANSTQSVFTSQSVCGSGNSTPTGCVICTPPKSYFDREKMQCTCPLFGAFDGTKCVTNTSCTGANKYPNPTNPSQCLTCDGGRVLSQNSCGCPAPTHWNGTACTTCPAPTTDWNGSSCICPQGTSGTACTPICTAPGSYPGADGACLNCPAPRVVVGGRTCTCPTATPIFTGPTGTPANSCISCVSPKVFNGYACVCGNGSTASDCSNPPPKPSPSPTIVPACNPPRTVINNICVCPTATPIYTGSGTPPNSCISCTSPRYWNGSSCSCQNGGQYNSTNNTCTSSQPSQSGCPTGQFRNASGVCTSCPTGATSDSTGTTCVCPTGSYYSGTSTNTCTTCPSPRSYWNGSSCVCPGDATYDQTNNKCVTAPTCTGNSFLNPSTQTCQSCPSGASASGGTCVCSSGYYTGYSSNTCLVCDSVRSYWNGSSCVCPNNGTYNPQNNSCATIPTCTGNTFLNPATQTCQSCPSGSTASYGSCVCSGGYYTGYETNSCVTCTAPRSYWNGSNCVCPNNGTYNSTTLQCE